MAQSSAANALKVIPNPLNVVSRGSLSIGKIMIDFNVVGVALGVLIGNNIVDLVNALNEGIIIPTLQPFLDRLQIKMGDKDEPEVSESKDDKKTGIQFNFTSLFTPLIKFITISLIVLFCLNLGTSLLETPSTNVVIIGVEPGVKLNGK